MASKASSILLAAILIVLVALLGLQIVTYSQANEERRLRQATADTVFQALDQLEKIRAEVFTEYQRDLESYETKSIYHQLYHAANAELKLSALLVQEQALMAAVVAGRPAKKE